MSAIDKLSITSFRLLSFALASVSIFSLLHKKQPPFSGLGKLPNFDPVNYQDARRYIENAKTILQQQAKPVNGRYSDRKYVRMAGDTAWKGVLIAAGNWLSAKGLKWDKRTRPDVNWFEKEIGARNRKLLSHFVDAYDILHRSLGYDGNLDPAISKAGLRHAEAFIRLCENDS